MSELWLGREFVALSEEAPPDLPPGEGMRAVLGHFERELGSVALSLDDTIRTRLWARDAAGRQEASQVRVEMLSGRRRSASSSFICPEHFESNASVALDLLALRTSANGSPAGKRLREYDPPLVPLRYLAWDGLVVLSGVTSERDGLAAQLEQMLPAIAASLADAGIGWERVVNVDCFVHRSVAPGQVRAALEDALPRAIPRITYRAVDGYSHPAKLCEIEVTGQA